MTIATDLATTILNSANTLVAVSATPADVEAPTIISPAPTISEMLDRWRAAHLRYRRALADRGGEALELLREAAVTRAQAELADPDHADPAWRDLGSTHPSALATHEELHLDLLKFYVTKLGLVEE